MTEECPICCDEYVVGKVIRSGRSVKYEPKQEVCCSVCQYKACADCIRRYLFGTVQAAHCMNCKVGWTYDFLAKIYQKSFVEKEWRPHQRKVLLEREKAYLPASQEIAETQKKNEELALIQRKIKEFEDYIHRIAKARASSNLTEEAVSQLDEEWKYAREQLEDLTRARTRALNHDQGPIVHSQEKTSRIWKCPSEDCRGFLNKRFNCALCGKNVCDQCLMIKPPAGPHTCKKEDIESVKMILTDTKACPKCASPIQRSYGCNQMWCTICHTAFDYSTGKIVNGTIHNPHYFEFREKMGLKNDPHEPHGPHGHLPEDQTLIRPHPAVDLFQIMFTQHHLQYLAHRRDDIHMRDFASLRVDYLLSRITEEQWAKRIEQLERLNERDTAVRGCLNVYVELTEAIVKEVQQMFQEECRNYYSLKEVIDSNGLSELQQQGIREKQEYVNLRCLELGEIRENLNKSISALEKYYVADLSKYKVIHTDAKAGFHLNERTGHYRSGPWMPPDPYRAPGAVPFPQSVGYLPHQVMPHRNQNLADYMTDEQFDEYIGYI